MADEDVRERQLMDRLVENGEPVRKAMQKAGTDIYTHPYTAPAGRVHEQASTEYARHYFNKHYGGENAEAFEAYMREEGKEVDAIEREDPRNVFDPTGAKTLAARLQKLEDAAMPDSEDE